jgi:hypothetical protein
MTVTALLAGRYVRWRSAITRGARRHRTISHPGA